MRNRFAGRMPDESSRKLLKNWPRLPAHVRDGQLVWLEREIQAWVASFPPPLPPERPRLP